MQLGAISAAVNPQVTMTDISVAVLSKNLDTIEKAGQNLIQMMEQSVQPHLGNNIDFRI